jgi:2-keto-3-deoxy-L-rhamnonate aldolase RhmA
LSSNQSIGLAVARSLTLVGLTRQSIGRVVVLCHQGHRGQRRHAGLAHRHQVGAGAKQFSEGDDMLDVLVQAEAAFGQWHLAGVAPVGDVDVVVGQQGAGGVAQQRGEVARQRCHDQHLGPAGVDRVAQVVADEALQRAEGFVVHRHLAHRHLALAHTHRFDAERRSLVRQPQP